VEVDLTAATWARFLRIALIPFILLAMSNPWGPDYLVAAALYWAAASTDALDGYLARRRGGDTREGTFLDLTADKLLASCTMIVMLGHALLPAWVVIVVVARELAVTGLRSHAASKGQPISTNIWGKAKTAVTSLAIAGILLREDLARGGSMARANPLGLAGAVLSFAWPLMVVAVTLTVFSGASYVLFHIRGLRSRG
jgi:CDP-diacylglycerol--glycerol-3-phosphate 3-phosphatidyltransferase